MYTIKTWNAISPVGLAKLNNKQFDVAVDTDTPDGILVRSADMLNTAFNDNLLAIARAGAGVRFPKKTADRDDFERTVRTIDEMFYAGENAKLWCLGVEGVTYTIDGDKIVYSDDIVNSADGIYKSMQLKYGCGSDVTQMVWINEREMSKYDENSAEINTEVAAMDNAIQPVPPTPQFDDLTAEDAASLRTPLGDTFEVWADAFITGKKSTDTDWDAYVAEMKNLSIDQYLQMYNDNNK